jgi:hypothetical protein
MGSAQLKPVYRMMHGVFQPTLEILPETLPTGVFFVVGVRFEIRTDFRFKHSLVL